MNTKLIVPLAVVAALCGVLAVATLHQAETARAAYLSETRSVRDAEQTVAELQRSLPFTLRELRVLPAGYALESSALRQSPTGSANATTAILNYRGRDGGFLELTQLGLYLNLDGAQTLSIGGRDVQYVEHSSHPDGVTRTRSYVWRDGDVSLQLNVFIPQTASKSLTDPVLTRVIGSAR